MRLTNPASVFHFERVASSRHRLRCHFYGIGAKHFNDDTYRVANACIINKKRMIHKSTNLGIGAMWRWLVTFIALFVHVLGREASWYSCLSYMTVNATLLRYGQQTCFSLLTAHCKSSCKPSPRFIRSAQMWSSPRSTKYGKQTSSRNKRLNEDCADPKRV